MSDDEDTLPRKPAPSGNLQPYSLHHLQQVRQQYIPEVQRPQQITDILPSEHSISNRVTTHKVAPPERLGLSTETLDPSIKRIDEHYTMF